MTAACIDEEGLFADKNQHIYEVACELGKRGSTRHMLEEFCNAHGIDLWEDRLSDLTEEELTLLKYGEGGKTKFYGLIPWINMLVNGAVSTSGRLAYLLTNAGMLERKKCPKCGGTGLGEKASHTTFGGRTITELEEMYISDILEMSVDEAADFFADKDKSISGMLKVLQRVGMGYIKLGQATPAELKEDRESVIGKYLR